MGKEWDSFRVDPRAAARWSAEKSGGAGAGFGPTHLGGDGDRPTVLPAYHKRRTTAQCRACGKRGAFRNPHACDPYADWVTIPVDVVPIEARAFGEWCRLWAVEALRVLKPGGHLLAAGSSRTHHRLACALEDAGFDVRDTIVHLFGSGFPKSMNVSKAIDRAAGAAREKVRVDGSVARNPKVIRGGRGVAGGDRPFMVEAAERWYHEVDGEVPVTDDAREWDGWGTALKPAAEFWTLARKPLSEGTVAANVLKWGTGALNVDGSRVGRVESRFNPSAGNTGMSAASVAPVNVTGYGGQEVVGRWPANVLITHSPGCERVGMRRVRAGTSNQGVVHGTGLGSTYLTKKESGAHYADADGMEDVETWHCEENCAVRLLDEQSGETQSPQPGTVFMRASSADGYGNRSAAFGAECRRAGVVCVSYGDAGGASRFFKTFPGGAPIDDGEEHVRHLYTGKAPGSERWAWCRRCAKALSPGALEAHDRAYRKNKAHMADITRHPTVKPVDLIAYLVKLVTPLGGVVLDPFAGSGTLAPACRAAGDFSAVLIERDPDYLRICEARSVAGTTLFDLDSG